MQLDGLVVIGEFLDHFEADVAAATLRAEGIETAFDEDSRHALLGHGLLGPGTRGTDPVFRLLVRAEDAERARTLVDLGDRSLPAAFREGEVAEWVDQVHAGQSRRRRLRRAWVLAWLYGLAALVLVAALAGALAGR